MNSRKPSKPNLPSAPKPSKLLAPTGLHWTLSSLDYRIPQSPIASIKINWSLLNCFPSTKMPPHKYGHGEIRIWLMYLSRMYQWRRWEKRNLENQSMKIVDESILSFFRVSLSKFFLEALYIFWYKYIYSRMCMECK